MTTRLFSILLMIAAMAASCASNDLATTDGPNVAVEAIDDTELATDLVLEPSNSEGEVEEIEVTPVENTSESETDTITTVFDPTGTWDTGGGDRLKLTATGSVVTGRYDNGGRVEGTLRDRVIEGIWFNDTSTTICTGVSSGSSKWGRFTFTFTEDATAFTGEWGYCDGPYEDDWSGTQTSGPALIQAGRDFRAIDSSQWADETVDLVISEDVAGARRNPEQATGPADVDYRGFDELEQFYYVSLGNALEECEYYITVEFVDNRLYDGDGPDLRIFELGSSYFDGVTEPFSVWVDVDGTFVRLEQTAGDIAEFDLDGVTNEDIAQVRICDLPGNPTEWPYPGPDIDAVLALNSKPTES